LAPAIFGAGLLEAVPESALADRVVDGKRRPGRFGWQGLSISVREQTAKALAQEMGVTSEDQPHDDCTPAETDCHSQHRKGAAPEILNDQLESLVAFERTLEVPRSDNKGEVTTPGARLFNEIGCSSCHRPELRAELTLADGTHRTRMIGPYSDLLLHDM